MAIYLIEETAPEPFNRFAGKSIITDDSGKVISPFPVVMALEELGLPNGDELLTMAEGVTQLESEKAVGFYVEVTAKSEDFAELSWPEYALVDTSKDGVKIGCVGVTREQASDLEEAMTFVRDIMGAKRRRWISIKTVSLSTIPAIKFTTS